MVVTPESVVGHVDNEVTVVVARKRMSKAASIRPWFLPAEIPKPRHPASLVVSIAVAIKPADPLLGPLLLDVIAMSGCSPRFDLLAQRADGLGVLSNFGYRAGTFCRGDRLGEIVGRSISDR